MARNKIGFHTAGSGGNPNGIGQYTQTLAAADIPSCIVCADGVVGIGDALATGKPHHLLFRVVRDSSEQWAVPDYNRTPKDAAIEYRQRLLPYIHPTVAQNRDKVWVILGNELDKDRSDWLGQWAYESALIWNADGYKVALFGWSSGEPEPEHWQLPGMRQFLELAAERPDTVAVALHEYSYDVTNIKRQEGWLIGRFSLLFDACAAMKLARPTVFITEWGWTHNNAPAPAQAMADIEWAAQLYAYYRNIKGVATWYLGPDFGGIANKVQPLIAPVTQATLSWQFLEEAEPEPPPPTPPPPGETLPEFIWRVGLELAPTNYDAALQKIILADGWTPYGRETWRSYGADAYAIQPAIEWQSKARRTYYARVPDWGNVQWIDAPQPPGFTFTHWPTDYRVVTQRFGANPDYYKQFNLPGHEGVDFRAPHATPVYAVADGVVSDIRQSATGHNYGRFVRVKHADSYETTNAHLHEIGVSLGQEVKGGQYLGLADNTGNSNGSHLHLTLKRAPGDPGWPFNIVNPEPFMQHFLGVTWPAVTPPPPAPPPPPTIDLLPYLRGDGRLYEVQNANGGQERFQSQVAGSTFYQTKNAHWEELRFDDSFIYRDRDTSPGGGRWYRLLENNIPGSRWIPRHWRAGESYTRARRVQFYRKSDCQPVPENSGDVIDTMRFVAHRSSYTFRTGLTLPDVVELEWVGGGERYFYARGFGLVAWERSHQDPATPQWSAISEIHASGARPDNVRESGCFS
jgi:murein DD-endopeptidase MepM/ murein hydrolase activator NlpD